MDLHSPLTLRNMVVVFEPSFWCKTDSTTSLLHVHDAPTSSAFYNLTVPFMGPTRRSPASHRSDPINSGERIPRPPNAWILYRSDKLKEMPPPPPGMPRRPQADISKTISAMWKVEPPEVRAEYERLSDIKKAEHLLAYPNYRFKPVKKAEKDRLRAVKLAEKERERGERNARKPKPQPRVGAVQGLPPLFTTGARFGPADPSPLASGVSMSPVGQFTSQQPTPPNDHPTPSSNHSSTPVPLAPSPSSYPPSPATTAIPPLLAPQPGVPQRPPSASDWTNERRDRQTPLNELEFNDLWLKHGSLPDIPHFSGSQEYLTIPIPNHPPQQPLGWSPHDPSPHYLPSYNSNRMHSVLAATAEPFIYQLGVVDTSLFNGTQKLQVSMGNGFLVGDDNQSHTCSTLFATTSPSSQSDAPRMHTSTNEQVRLNMHFDMESTSTLPADFDNLGYSFDNFVDDRALEGQDVVEKVDVMTASEPHGQPGVPYVPPAGASHSSNRRVAAEWHSSPEPEEVWNNEH